jgi:adenine deaminase
MVRTTIAEGVNPVTAIRLGTINAAEYFRLFDRGAVAPGRRADLVVFSDLHDLRPELVFRGGKLVARDGVMLPWERPISKTKTRGAVNINWGKVDLRIPANGDSIRVIGTIPDQLVTEQLFEMPKIEAGCAVADPERDLLKMAVIERHLATGNVGLGFIKGFGLKRGAIASTIAHDHHNLVVIGADDQSMLTAARAVADTLGGQAVAEGDQVLAQLSLPIAGLMSDRPIEEVRDSIKNLITTAQALGTDMHDPFMAMSFSALEVIPSLKLTDQGLVDVDRLQIVPIFAD